jgi:hypothetical protein
VHLLGSPCDQVSWSSTFLIGREANAVIDLYLLVRTLLRLLVPQGHGEAAKDLEIIVLQHEVDVLWRQIKRR